jgi:SAM-dependent methyltransferase
MDKSRHGSVELTLRWESADARHAERLHLDKVNFWRDIFPADLGERLAGSSREEPVTASLPAGDLVLPHDPAQRCRLPPSALRRTLAAGPPLQPHAGRFYPRGLLSGIPGSYPQDRRPFRYLGERESGLDVDLNHPLARYPLSVEASIVRELPTSEEHGGRCNDIPEELTSGGPGLEASYPGVETEFLAGTPFAREDEREDGVFYGAPRLVSHIDEVAMAHVRALYGRLLRPGMRVLDLMSSWISHLPEIETAGVTGVGMNAEELGRNPRLGDWIVHDLNREIALPLPSGSFDAAICTVSVEYLTRPVEVFAEVARVLRPGAPFVVTFSDRWFPPKVVRVWTELHPFERMGLVLQYFRRSGEFECLQTESTRGWPRPDDDKYASVLAHSDPVYAVWGTRVGPREPVS